VGSPGIQPPAGGEFDVGEPLDAIDDVDDIGEGTGGGSEDAKDPLRFSNWMKRSTTGAVMTGIAMGLQQALEPQNRNVPFVIEAKGEPDDPDRPIDLKFDPDSPADTVAIIRRPATGDDPPS
jgi:hypothetical protein